MGPVARWVWCVGTAACLSLAVLLGLGGAASAASSTWQTALTTVGPSSFASVSCPTASVCTAVGGGPSGLAAIYRTTDGGASWAIEAPPPAAPNLTEVSCATTEICVATGPLEVPTTDPSDVYVTTDAGATWRYTTWIGSLDTYVTALDCPTTAVCYADDGGMNVSTDEGRSWWSSSTQVDATIMGLACPTAATCFTVAYGASTSRSRPLEIERWTDGARRVATVFSRRWAKVPNVGRPSIACTSATVCVVAGAGASGGLVLTTTDGGERWRPRPMPPGIGDALDVACAPGARCAVAYARAGRIDEAVTSVARAGWRTEGIAGTSGPTWTGALACPRVARCTLAGFDASGAGLYQQPRGEGAWRSVALASGTQLLYAAACPSAAECVAVGDGVVLRSTDGGATWSAATSPPAPTVVLRSVACSSATACVAVGVDTATIASLHETTAVAYRSTDGGESWSRAELPAGDAALQQVTCPSGSTCVAVAQSFDNDLPVLYSTDGGATWSASVIPTGNSVELDSVSCGSATHCLGVGSDGSFGLVATSTDGGATWTFASDASTPSLVGISCSTATACVAAGVGQPYSPGYSGSLALGTTDGGVAWTQLSQVPEVDGVSVECDGEVCQALSLVPWTPWQSSLATSDDGGTTWSMPSLPTSAEILLGVASIPGGGWVLVGGDSENGSLILTS